MNTLAEKYLRKEALPTIFCPGCGDGIVLNSFIRALEELGLKEDLACVSGIGCSSWVPVYLDVDVIHSLHGRAIPHAEGLKIAAPDKTVVVFSGDGDALGIGGNHLIHAARRNIDLTVIMMNNYIYGMTGGQKAPTTPYHVPTKTSPLGNEEYPFDTEKLVVGAGATFFARGCSAYPKQLTDYMVQAINHKGFSFIEVLSPCPTQAGRLIFSQRKPEDVMQWYKDHTYFYRAGMDTSKLADKLPLGVLYSNTERQEYTQSLEVLRKAFDDENQD